VSRAGARVFRTISGTNLLFRYSTISIQISLVYQHRREILSFDQATILRIPSQLVPRALVESCQVPLCLHLHSDTDCHPTTVRDTGRQHLYLPRPSFKRAVDDTEHCNLVQGSWTGIPAVAVGQAWHSVMRHSVTLLRDTMRPLPGSA
jgi:hypothetical protein